MLPVECGGLGAGSGQVVNKARSVPAPVYFPVIKGGIDAMIYSVVAGEKRDFTAKQYERAGHQRAIGKEIEKRGSYTKRK